MNNEVTQSLIDKVIMIDRGGPESKIGLLLHTGDDYIAILTEDDGVVYYNSQHIKSITENAKGNMEFDIEVPENFEYKIADSFEQLLESFKYNWVKVNRGEPVSVEGVLAGLENDFVYVIANEEVVRIVPSHINNVSLWSTSWEG